MVNNQLIKELIKPGDILLSRHKTHPISHIIAGITKSYWSHAFLYIGDNKIIESSIGGVAVKPLSHYLNDEYDVGIFRVTGLSSEKDINLVIKEARKKIGLNYSYLQIVWFFLLRLIGKSEDPDWSFDVEKGMVCSELIAHAYKVLGIEFKKDFDPSLIEPGDLDESTLTIRIM